MPRAIAMSEIYGLRPWETIKRFDQILRGDRFYLDDYDYETDVMIVGRNNYYRKIGDTTAIRFREGVLVTGETTEMEPDQGVIVMRDF